MNKKRKRKKKRQRKWLKAREKAQKHARFVEGFRNYFVNRGVLKNS